MSESDILIIIKEAVQTALLISSPFLIISIALGLVIAVFQAATQIHEQTITFVPKIIGIALVLLFLGSWIISIMVNFTQSIFTYMNGIL